MRFTLLTQVALLTLSVAIIFLFIKPALTDIKTVQDELLVYSDAVAKASEYNKRLQELLSLRDSFSQNDLAKLERFVPQTIDTIRVMHEIENIFASKNIKLASLVSLQQSSPEATTLAAGEGVPVNPATAVSSQDFEVKFTGDYQTLKMMLEVLESNARLLEVVDVTYGTPVADKKDAEKVIKQIDNNQFLIIRLRAYALEGAPIAPPSL